MRGLWKLTWLEIKIFLREPLGAIGTLLFPILIFIVLGKLGGGRINAADRTVPGGVGPDLPIFASILISLSIVVVSGLTAAFPGNLMRHLHRLASHSREWSGRHDGSGREDTVERIRKLRARGRVQLNAR